MFWLDKKRKREIILPHTPILTQGSERKKKSSAPMRSMASKKKRREGIPGHFRKLTSELQYKIQRVGIRIFRLKTSRDGINNLNRASSQISDVSNRPYHCDLALARSKNSPSPAPLTKSKRPIIWSLFRNDQTDFSPKSSKKFLETEDPFAVNEAIVDNQIKMQENQFDLYKYISDDRNVDYYNIDKSYQVSVEDIGDFMIQTSGEFSCSAVNYEAKSFDNLPPNHYVSDTANDIFPTCCEFNCAHLGPQPYSEGLCPDTHPSSRNASPLPPSFNSCRDSAFSTFSFTNSERKDKGRSDPFDLEFPELWRPRIEQNLNSDIQKGDYL